MVRATVTYRDAEFIIGGNLVSFGAISFPGGVFRVRPCRQAIVCRRSYGTVDVDLGRGIRTQDDFVEGTLVGVYVAIAGS